MRDWMNTRRWVAGSFLLFLLGSTGLPAAWAETRYERVYDARLHKYVYVPERTTTQRIRSGVNKAFRSPVVKQAGIGAAAGAAAGLLTDRSSVLKGAGVGAIVGAGTGLLDKSQILDDHPAVKTATKGAAIGTGVGIVTGKGAGKGAAVGAAAGTGVHFVREYLNKRDRME